MSSWVNILTSLKMILTLQIDFTSTEGHKPQFEKSRAWQMPWEPEREGLGAEEGLHARVLLVGGATAPGVETV